MENLFKTCSKIRPLTVTLCSFMTGVFYNEKMYWACVILTAVIIGNLFYLKSKE